MRKIIVSLIMLLGIVSAANAQPQWVLNRPVLNDAYVGIGSASLQDADYMQKATHDALADIAMQIAVKVENNSFLQRVDVDGKTREMLDDKISTSMLAWMEGHELKESSKANGKYYVYYILNKKVYERNAAQRRDRAISVGLDYLVKGREAENQMNLSQAAMLYGKGLEAVEPWTFMDLSTEHDGKVVNIPVELYNACVSLFSNMAITTNATVVEGEAFKSIAQPIAACLSRNGEVIPNVKLKAEFVTGSGTISAPIETDYTGTALFYVTNITSKSDVQEVRIAIDKSFISSLPASYVGLLNNQSWPSAKVTIALKSSPITAYLHINSDNDIEGIEKRISSVLTNNYFSLTEDPDAAQCFIDMSSKLDMGPVVTGGTYDLNSFICSVIIKIYNNQTQELLLNYNVSGVKALVPVHKSVEESYNVCIREVMKRINRELPVKIKNLKIN